MNLLKLAEEGRRWVGALHSFMSGEAASSALRFLL